MELGAWSTDQLNAAKPCSACRLDCFTSCAANNNKELHVRLSNCYVSLNVRKQPVTEKNRAKTVLSRKMPPALRALRALAWNVELVREDQSQRSSRRIKLWHALRGRCLRIDLKEIGFWPDGENEDMNHLGNLWETREIGWNRTNMDQ